MNRLNDFMSYVGWMFSAWLMSYLIGIPGAGSLATLAARWLGDVSKPIGAITFPSWEEANRCLGHFETRGGQVENVYEDDAGITAEYNANQESLMSWAAGYGEVTEETIGALSADWI